MEVGHETSSIPMTSSEIAYLWNAYLLNSKSKHILMYAAAQSSDREIKSIMQLSLDLSAKILSDIKVIFDAEKQRVPYGFTEADVYVEAPKIYSDKLMLYILKVYAIVGLSNYGVALSASPRKDIRQLFTDALIAAIDLSNKIDDLALKKGIYLRTPNIPVTQQVEFAGEKSIMGKMFGHKRSLTAIEISSVFNCSMVNSISEAQMLGMAQTIGDDRLKEFINRTRKTLKEQSEILNEILHKEDLLFPASIESEVLKSSEPVFSDRLSMFFCFATLADILSIFSIAKVGVIRKDVFITLSQLSSEVIFLIKDATDLMLERNWFEEMPKNVRREDLI